MQFSSMVSKIFIIITIFQIFIFSSTKAETWIRAAYYQSAKIEFPISNINSSLFTHLICGFADIDSTSYKLSFPQSDIKHISTFTETVKKKNPSVTTLLSIGVNVNQLTFSSMVSNSLSRTSFINSSIEEARRYGFQGLDFWWIFPRTSDDMDNIDLLFKEWRQAITVEATNSTKTELILTAVVNYSPKVGPQNYPVYSIQKYLDWVHVRNGEYFLPNNWTNFTAAPMALYNPNSTVNNTDYGIRSWIDAGLSPKKMVLFLPYYGSAWTLKNPNENGIGAPAIEQAQTLGLVYKEIKTYIDRYKAKVTFDATYVVNYLTIGTSWIAFDDVDAIRRKVSYAKEKGLLGYFVWQVTYDDNNWLLSKAAAQGGHEIIFPPPEDNRNGQKKQPYRLLGIVLPIIAAVILLLGFVIYIYCRWMRKKNSEVQESRNHVIIATATAAAGDFSGNAPTLALYSLAYIEEATNRFSSENKLGEGGYGPVYKGVLQDGQEVAVKKLSKTSTQGFEEFKNEVMLTAKLQHVNLVKLLGFCIEREEHMLIYEYMPNRSLDYYLFDPIKKYKLDWQKRIHIIEGICQGLIYLQEYSRLTIIHRDLKASNVLLDNDMKPKISDFGMARIFTKDGLEANTGRIVGTYGYAPPEYIKRGIYSTKSDVYSFGVLLLQIIGGKRVSILYGGNDRLSLLEYAYELWKDGKGMEFVDRSLDDTNSPCRLIRCLHIALLCVQEMPIDRPSMLEVSWMLRNEATNLMIPKKPDLSKQTDHEVVQKESSTSNSEIRSDNDTTVSNMEVR